jgi:hypothetical protein
VTLSSGPNHRSLYIPVYGSPTTRTVSLALTLAVAIGLGVLAGTGPASAQQARDVGEPDVAARP